MTDYKPPASPLRIALIGAGRVGTATALLLQDAGHRIVGVASRTPASASAAAERLGAHVFDIEAGLPHANVILVAVPDREIRTVAERIDAGGSNGAVACHFSGALGLDVLAPIANGQGVCALHPVQACPDVDLAIKRLPGSAWGITCSPGLEAWAHELVEADLRGRPVAVSEEDRPLWHAATVTTANGITALLAGAEAMLRAIRIERPLDVLGPLASGAVQNARDTGDAASVLTGPAIRGDVATLRLHLEALRQRVPDLRDAYQLAARLTIDAARRSGNLDVSTDAELENVLEGR
ncbi:MAG: Rossmann-like and DUF2520 domain-containing protein [Actinomycetota bacterium]